MSSPSPTAAPSPGPTPPPPFKIYQPGERPDENRGYELMATCVTLTVLADAIVCLRLYVKRSFVRIIGVDDHLMVLAAVRSLPLPPLLSAIHPPSLLRPLFLRGQTHN